MDGTVTGPGASGGAGYVQGPGGVTDGDEVAPAPKTRVTDSTGKSPDSKETNYKGNADDPVPVGGNEAPVGGVSDMKATSNRFFGASVITSMFAAILAALEAMKEGAMAAVGSVMTGMELKMETTESQATKLKNAGEHKMNAAAIEGAGGAFTAIAAAPGAVATTKAIYKSGSVLGEQQRALQKPVDDAYKGVGDAGDALNANKIKVNSNQTQINQLEARQADADTFTVSQNNATAGTATVTTTPAPAKEPLTAEEQTTLQNLKTQNEQLRQEQTALQETYDQKRVEVDKQQAHYDQYQAEKPLALREHEYINGDKGVAWTRAYQPLVSGLGTSAVAPLKGMEERNATVDEANAALDAGYAAQFQTGTDASIQAAKDNNEMASSMVQWLQSTSDNISRATHWGPA